MLLHEVDGRHCLMTLKTLDPNETNSVTETNAMGDELFDSSKYG